jgi:uncharacterized membrane protein
MNRTTLIYILLCVPLVVLDAALFLTGKIPVYAAFAGLGTFAVFIFVFWFRRLGGQKVEKDERTIRLSRKAATFSWQISVYVVALLIGSDTLGLLRLTGLQYLGIVMMVMTYSYLILHFVMNRKGDVE